MSVPCDRIKRLQVMLNSRLRPPPNLTVDGIMGPRTRAAVAAFEAARDTIPSPEPPALIVGTAPPGKPPAAAGDASTWMAIASGELGVAEIPGPANNARIVAYHQTTTLHAQDDETPWCASFVNWVLRQDGKVGTGSAAARSFIGWGRAVDPQYGAITVVRRIGQTQDKATGSSSGYHVAFLVSITGNRVRLLGGNQADSVRISGFNLASYSIEATRWPV